MEGGTDLQFERAQFDAAPSGSACASCAEPLHGSYFQVNGATVCEACCYRLQASFAGGSPGARVLKASAAGLAAAVAGTLLYYAILAMTGYEFALIAIVVGIAVGRAVRWGSSGRGGWPYQTLAVVLTYLSIVGAYVPMIVTELMKQPPAQVETTAPGVQKTPADTSAVTPQTAAALETSPGAAVAGLLLAFVLLLALACAAPFLAGVQNIIGLVIIGIGVWQAWKLNRRMPLVVTGPHTLAAGPAPSGQ